MKQTINGQEIRTIIFDLGGVIINIDPWLTVNKFAKICKQPPKQVMKKLIREPFLYEYEKGLIPCKDFRNNLRALLQVTSDDRLLDEAWNELLLDIPTARIELLKTLRKEYKLVLLSNTNRIHHDRFLKTLEQVTGCDRFEEFFDAVYYSFLMKKRKPDPEIFSQVLEEQRLKADETLFLDDNVENLTGAESLGIRTLLVKGEETLKSYFNGHFPLKS